MAFGQSAPESAGGRLALWSSEGMQGLEELMKNVKLSSNPRVRDSEFLVNILYLPLSSYVKEKPERCTGNPIRAKSLAVNNLIGLELPKRMDSAQTGGPRQQAWEQIVKREAAEWLHRLIKEQCSPLQGSDNGFCKQTQEACFILYGSLPLWDKPYQVANQPHRAKDPDLQLAMKAKMTHPQMMPPFL